MLYNDIGKRVWQTTDTKIHKLASWSSLTELVVQVSEYLMLPFISFKSRKKKKLQECFKLEHMELGNKQMTNYVHRQSTDEDKDVKLCSFRSVCLKDWIAKSHSAISE